MLMKSGTTHLAKALVIKYVTNKFIRFAFVIVIQSLWSFNSSIGCSTVWNSKSFWSSYPRNCKLFFSFCYFIEISKSILKLIMMHMRVFLAISYQLLVIVECQKLCLILKEKFLEFSKILAFVLFNNVRRYDNKVN